MKRLCHIA